MAVSEERGERLRRYLDALAPVEWGENDCCHTVAGWIAAETGQRPRLPSYAGEDEALALVARHGGLVNLVAPEMARLRLPVIDTPQLGDAGIVRLARRDVMAIFGPANIAYLRRLQGGAFAVMIRSGLIKAWTVPALAACLALMLMSSPASADPISLIAIGITTLLPAVGVVTAKIIATGLLIGGLIGAQLLLAPDAEQPQVDPSDFKSTFKAEVSAEINAIGRVRLGGVIVFGNTDGPWRYRLTGRCKGPLDGVEEIYLGGQEVVVDPDVINVSQTGWVNSPPWGGVVMASNVGWVVAILDKIGDGSEIAWPQLIEAFPEQWSVTHRVRGIGQSLVRYASTSAGTKTFATLYQGGEPPVEEVLRALLVYDPRDDSTHWSDNGILCALHVFISQWPEFTLADFDLPFLASEADRADEPIPTRSGGTIPRSRCSGVWLSETPRVEVMEQLLRSIGAEVVLRPGDLLGIALIDDARVAEVNLPARHILEIGWRSGPESVERPNLAVVKYYSPERKYEMAELELQRFNEAGVFIGPPWARIQSEIDAYGEKPLTIELPFCTQSGQAQRIARRLFAVARADTGIATMNWTGLAAWGARTAALELPDELGSALVALGPPRVLDDRGAVELAFITWPDLPPWNVASDEVNAPEDIGEVHSNINMARPFPPNNAQAAGGITQVTLYYRSGNRLEACYRRVDSPDRPGPWRPLTFTDPFPLVPGATVIATAPENLTGIATEFRSRHYSLSFEPEIPDDAGSQLVLTGYRISKWSDTWRVVVGAVAPVLSGPAGAATGATTASLSVTTDSASGLVYFVVTTSGTPPSQAQVKAGFDQAGLPAPDRGSRAVTATGAQAMTAAGLTAATTYFAHFMHESGDGAQSVVASSASFTMAAA